MKTIRECLFFGNRSQFDSHYCSSKYGFAQVDTRQDAPYFGIWANPTTFKIITFCEGDLITVECDNSAEFVVQVRELKTFYEESFVGIDALGDVKDQFVKLGLGDLLH